MYIIEDLENLVCELAHKRVKDDYNIIKCRPHFSGMDYVYTLYKNYVTREYTNQAQEDFEMECDKYREILEEHLDYKTITEIEEILKEKKWAQSI